MPKIHYLVRRTRSGRFNFTLISEAGRIAGSVVVATSGKTAECIDLEAREKIRHVAEAFAGQQAIPIADRRPRRLHDLDQVDIKTW